MTVPQPNDTWEFISMADKRSLDAIQVLEKVLDDFEHDGIYYGEEYQKGFEKGINAAIKAIDEWMSKEKTHSARP